MSVERSEFIRQCRNTVLTCLGSCSPGSLLGESLYLVLVGLYPEYNRTCCVKDLYYLERKGYAERRHPRTGKVCGIGDVDWNKANWGVTPEGDEIANQLVSDPALGV